VTLVEVGTWRTRFERQSNDGTISILGFALDSSLLALDFRDRTVRLFNAETGTETFRTWTEASQDSALSPEGRQVAVASEHALSLFDIQPERSIARLRFEGGLSSVAFDARASSSADIAPSTFARVDRLPIVAAGAGPSSRPNIAKWPKSKTIRHSPKAMLQSNACQWSPTITYKRLGILSRFNYLFDVS
jgi:WD40 repeat protein